MLHIELRRWADVLLIAPLDANTLGKIASGICDNLLVREGRSFCSPLELNTLMRPVSPNCRTSLTDLCGESMGQQSPSSVLPCNEYGYVASPHYGPADIQTDRVWIC